MSRKGYDICDFWPPCQLFAYHCLRPSGVCMYSYVFASINNTQKLSDAQWVVHWLHKILQFFAAISEFEIKNTGLKGRLDHFVTTTEEPGICKPVNGSPSAICKLRFPLFWEYFQWQSLLNNTNASVIQYKSLLDFYF